MAAFLELNNLDNEIRLNDADIIYCYITGTIKHIFVTDRVSIFRQQMLPHGLLMVLAAILVLAH